MSNLSDFAVPVEIERADPAHYTNFTSLTAGQLVTGFAAIVYGYALKNTSSSVVANIDIYDGVDTSGANPIFPITLAANESSRDWFGDMGIRCRIGLYANVTTGTVSGAIFYRHVRIPW